MLENADQNNSEYWHLRSGGIVQRLFVTPQVNKRFSFVGIPTSFKNSDVFFLSYLEVAFLQTVQTR